MTDAIKQLAEQECECGRGIDRDRKCYPCRAQMAIDGRYAHPKFVGDVFEVARLRSELKASKEALEEIRAVDDPDMWLVMRKIAREALEE